jgi:hypothetical protein
MASSRREPLSLKLRGLDQRKGERKKIRMEKRRSEAQKNESSIQP